MLYKLVTNCHAFNNSIALSAVTIFTTYCNFIKRNNGNKRILPLYLHFGRFRNKNNCLENIYKNLTKQLKI